MHAMGVGRWEVRRFALVPPATVALAAVLTIARCEGFGDCKDANTASDCTSFTNMSTTTDCGTCSLCNGTGSCSTYDAAQDADCALCQECSGLGTCAAQPAGMDLKDECPSGSCVTSFCDGTGVCGNQPATTDCGLCATCNASGLCSTVPSDDSGCGTIDCDLLDVECRNYADLTAGRCEGLDNCKDANTSDCTSYTNMATTTLCDAASFKACDGSGACLGTPADDAACGTVDCDLPAPTCPGFLDLATPR